MHITPSKRAVFNWQFNKTLRTYEIVERDHVINASAGLITIVGATDIIKVPEEKPIFVSRDF